MDQNNFGNNQQGNFNQGNFNQGNFQQPMYNNQNNYYKPKKPIYKRVWFWVIIVIVLIGVAGASSSSNDKPKKVDNTEQSDKSNAPEIFNVGDTIELKDFKVTVNGVRTTTQDSSGFQKADDGKEYFLVNCTIENISDKEQTVSSVLMFKVVDQNGMSYDQKLFTDAEGQLDGTIAPTRKITGEYCVEVPQGQTGLELEFDSSFIGRQQIIVKLN